MSKLRKPLLPYALCLLLAAFQAMGPAAATAADLSASDPRVKWWVDPRQPLQRLKHEAYLMTNADPFSLPQVKGVAEPGQRGEDSQLRFGRVKDPLNSAKWAFVHRIASGYSPFRMLSRPNGPGYNANMSSVTGPWSGSGESPMQNEPVWIAFAVKFEPDMFGHRGKSLSFMELHHVPDGHDSNPLAHFAMFADQNELSIVSRADPNTVGTVNTRQDTTLFRERNPSTTQWHYFVIQARFTYSAARDPYLRIWRRVGSGPVEQIADHKDINAYNDAARYMPPYFGIYMWDHSGFGNSPTRTLYTKGMFILRDEPMSPNLNAGALFSLLDSV